MGGFCGRQRMVDRICRGVTTLCNEVLGGLLNNMINEIKGNNIILREQKIEDAKFFYLLVQSGTSHVSMWFYGTY